MQEKLVTIEPIGKRIVRFSDNLYRMREVVLFNGRSDVLEAGKYYTHLHPKRGGHVLAELVNAVDDDDAVAIAVSAMANIDGMNNNCVVFYCISGTGLEAVIQPVPDRAAKPCVLIYSPDLSFEFDTLH